MKICLRKDSVIRCDRETADCVGCVPGNLVSVERISNSQLLEVAAGNTEHILELSRIIVELINIYKNAWFSMPSKRALHKQLVALRDLRDDISDSCNIILLNLLMNHIEDMLPQDELIHQREIFFTPCRE